MTPSNPTCPLEFLPEDEELARAEERARDQTFGPSWRMTPPACLMDGVVVDRFGNPLN